MIKERSLERPRNIFGSPGPPRLSKGVPPGPWKPLKSGYFLTDNVNPLRIVVGPLPPISLYSGIRQFLLAGLDLSH